MTYARTTDTALGASLLELVRKDAKRKSRRKALGKFLGTLTLYVGFRLQDGWMFMIAVGIGRAEWIPALPTIGYWWACLVCYLLATAFNVVPIAKAKSKGSTDG